MGNCFLTKSVIALLGIATAAVPIAATAPAAATATADPAFALIAEKLAADLADCAAIMPPSSISFANRSTAATPASVVGPEAQPAADRRSCEAAEAIATSPPVHAGGFSLQGIVRLLRCFFVLN
jgi:hypothetical protein